MATATAVMANETEIANAIDVSGREHLYSLLEEGLDDISNGNVLTEEEMDKSIDLM